MVGVYSDDDIERVKKKYYNGINIYKEGLPDEDIITKYLNILLNGEFDFFYLSNGELFFDDSYQYELGEEMPIFLDIESTYSNNYIIEYKDIEFKYLSTRPYSIWWFNPNPEFRNKKTTYKLWFEMFEINPISNVNTVNFVKIYFLMLEQMYEILNNSKLKNSINQMKFFQNGPPYNIIIYLNNDIPLNNFNFFIKLFEFCQTINIGYSCIAGSPIICEFNKETFNESKMKTNLKYILNQRDERSDREALVL